MMKVLKQKFEPSTLQLAVLHRLAHGGVITRYQELHWHDGENDKRAPMPFWEGEKLRDEHLIELHERGGGRECYVISQRGRAVLERCVIGSGSTR